MSCARSAEQRKITSTSLFLVGEIGVNDYFVSALGRNRTVGEVNTFVPRVVAAVRSVVTVSSMARRVLCSALLNHVSVPPVNHQPHTSAHIYLRRK